MAACSASPSSSLSPTGPSAALGGAITEGEVDPCASARQSSASLEVVEPPVCEVLSGRFTGGAFQFTAADVRVTRGFTLHCDAILSNNFEVNWAGGNHFHMDKNPTNVTCTRTPNAPNPPAADANRIEIIGTGKLNGVAGATVHLVLVDNGEPGRNDQAFIAINDGAALTVGGSAAAPSTIAGGNIQAHFDQPHRR